MDEFGWYDFHVYSFRVADTELSKNMARNKSGAKNQTAYYPTLSNRASVYVLCYSLYWIFLHAITEDVAMVSHTRGVKR